MALPSVQTQMIIALVNALAFAKPQDMSIQEIRERPRITSYASTARIKEITEVAIPVASSSINVRLYIPTGTGPFPVFVNLHGGGWALGSLASNEGECRQLCHRVNCIVVAVDYRLAPEHKFPIPFDDCYAATAWVANNIKQYNGDPQKIAIGGASAGGNLAAAVALKARDEQAFPLVAQVLMVPVTDYNFETESYRLYANGFILTTEDMKWFWHLYTQTPQDAKHPYASPLRAASHANLPQTLILTAEFDPLRDDSYSYAQALKAAGVPVIQKTYPSVHSFMVMADRIDEGAQAVTQVVDYLRSVFAQ